MNGKESQTLEIKCRHCGCDYRVHKPMMVVSNTPVLSQMALVPSWSPDERACPQCKTVHMPIIAEANIAWVSANPEDNRKRLIQPAAAMPMMPAALAKLNGQLKH